MNQTRLTEGSIYKTIFFFSLPLLFSNILQSLNGTINSIWIGHYLGASAFAATANVNNILFVIYSLTFGIALASSIMVGQHYGGKRYDEAKQVVGTSVIFFIGVSIVIAGAGFVFAPDLLKLMHTPASVLPFAITYLRIILFSIPCSNLYNLATMVLRGAGDSKTPFYFMVVSVLIDTGLNPVLIFGLGPFPKMGIAGSATATVIAQTVSSVGLLVFLYANHHPLIFRRGELGYLLPKSSIMRVMLQRGLAMGLQIMVVSTSSFALINLVNMYGATATAAFSASNNITNYIAMPAMAIGASVSSMCAQNIGSGNWDRVRKTFHAGLLYNVVMTGALVVLVYAFNREVLHLFVSDASVITLGMRINDITAWSFILFGIMNVLTSTVRSTGAVMYPLIIAFVSLWLIRIPSSYYLAAHHGIDVVWWSFPLGFAFSSMLLYAYYRSGGWKKVNLIRQTKSAAAGSS